MRSCQWLRGVHLAILLPLCLALILTCLGLLLNWPRHRRAQLLGFGGVDAPKWRQPPLGGANASVATAAPRSPGQLDEATVRRLFSRMVHVAQKHSGQYMGRTAQMMSHQLPLIATDAWQLHSPAGKSYSLVEVQRLALDSAGAGFAVPNVAHFVLPFGNTMLPFHHMVCLLSCLHVMRPSRLLLWYAPGRLPHGEWWERLQRNLTQAEWEHRVIMVRRHLPTSIYTVPVNSLEHKSDIMRLEALLAIGGVYFDLDVVVLKPLEQLRRRECTIGREVSYGLCNGALVAEPNATFLAMWHTAYQVFNDAAWVQHSVWLPNSMNQAFPGLCHVEEESMQRPNWTPEEVHWIYGLGQQGRWNWREKNYVMHLWFRKYNVQHNMDSIRQLNSMFGELCRFILYGTP